jgi:NAD(P)-dependent dehydrogenase (short-subunit alcohol dehydrogenase family)
MVTGAGGGIGRAICLAFASAGAKVACLDIDLAAAEKTAGASGNEAIAQHCDVSSETETRDATAATISKFKAVHILVNAAATDDRNGTILDITAEEWSRVLAVNVTGAPDESGGSAEHDCRRRGSIIHIASQLGPVAAPNRAAYCTSKGALIQLAKAMAVDHAGQTTRCPRGQSRPAAYSCGVATWQGHDGKPDRSICSIGSVNLRKSPRPPYFWQATPQAL